MKKFALVAFIWALPLFAFAAVNRAPTALEVYIALIIDMINRTLVPLIFTIAFIVFIWGVYQFFIGSNGNEEKRKEGRSFILYGFIGFFVMISVWGIVNLLVGTFGFRNSSYDNRPELPTFDSGSGSRTNQNTQPTTTFPPATQISTALTPEQTCENQGGEWLADKATCKR